MESENHNLSGLWIENNWVISNNNLQHMINKYDTIENKNSSYAKGIKTLLDIHQRITDIWKSELRKAKNQR